MRLLRQIFSMLLVAAYVSATIFAIAPVAYAAPSDMSGGMMMKTDGTGDQMPMPCKEHEDPAASPSSAAYSW